MKFNTYLTCAAIFLSALMFARSADASLLHYELTAGPYNYSFELDSNPIVTPDDTNGGFYLTNVANSSPLPFEVLYFFENPSGLGGVAAYNSSDFSSPSFEAYFDLIGPQLFIGTLSSPTLITGEFHLTSYGLNEPVVLSVTAVPAVPEVSTWVMLLSGFFGVVLLTGLRKNRSSLLVHRGLPQ